MNECVCSVFGMILAGEDRSARRKPRAIDTLCTTHRTRTGLGSACAADICRPVLLLEQVQINCLVGLFTLLPGNDGYFVPRPTKGLTVCD